MNDPAHGYVSDYDILVILNRRELVEEYKIWNAAEDRITVQLGSQVLRPPLNILVHTLGEVNQALSEGQYFFTDIKREGIALYEFDKRELAEASQLTAEEYKAIAEKHYQQWFESAGEFFEFYEIALEKNILKKQLLSYTKLLNVITHVFYLF